MTTPAWEEVTRRLDDVLAKDMGLPCGRCGSPEPDSSTNWPGTYLIPIILDGQTIGAVGFQEPSSSDEFELGLREAGEMAQNLVMDVIRAATPQCPSHNHPVVADVKGGVAVWRCPTTDETWVFGAFPRPNPG